MDPQSALAIHGGAPAVPAALPTIRNSTGRDIGKEELALLQEVVQSGSLSFLYGTMVSRFEQAFAALHEMRNAVAVSSGTAAIHTALVYLDVGPGDEVAVPAITDMGSVIPILLQNAIPVFVDVNPADSTIDPDDLRRKISDRTKAVQVVHLYGYPCRMDEVLEICRPRGIPVVEDCAQALMTKYKGRAVGTIGDIGCFSFQQSKHITTGDGGMVISKRDSEYGRKLRLCADKGWPREVYRDHLFLAPAYHMTELQAAVGVAQLAKAERFVEARVSAAEALLDELSDIEGISGLPVVPWASPTYHLFPLRVDLTVFSVGTAALSEALRAEGLEADPGYIPHPIYEYPIVKDRITYGQSGCPYTCEWAPPVTIQSAEDCVNAEAVCKGSLVLAWNEFYTDKHIREISSAFHKVLSYYRK